jgi:antitoxin component YwqK of YwqJK toxin-antitoxin module
MGKINQRDAEGRLHGLWEDYRSDDTLWRRVHYHHDKQHGVWEDYHTDGQLRFETHYLHGVIKGIGTGFDARGRCISKQYNLVIR